MKAAVCTAYGAPDVLQVRTVRDPRPGRNDVCIRQVATAVTASDAIVRGLKLRGRYRLFMRLVFGWRAPRKSVIGMIVSGSVEAVGRDVALFKEGDAVFGMDGFRAGAYAEKVCWPASTQLALKPANLDYEEAAALPYGALLATYFLRRLKVGAGRQVLIYGASGAIGTAAVQLARHLGAEVTGVCSTTNLELVRSLGAASVIDYTKDDFTRDGRRYDVIFDAVGRRKSAQAMANAAAALAPGGVAMSVDDAFPRTTTADFLAIKDLAERGVLRPVIDRRYTLDEIAEAHRYVDAGHKKGNVIVRISP
ncbi:MAG TPA: NAD(P)-dependent alcohol dehydrogenase [Candidatus Dormibacteraeota bacterium]|nr:NAD(P)-dependent alcohol dehydrogenase [Candidatus Dormibacteraeota bacterium]